MRLNLSKGTSLKIESDSGLTLIIDESKKFFQLKKIKNPSKFIKEFNVINKENIEDFKNAFYKIGYDELKNSKLNVMINRHNYTKDFIKVVYFVVPRTISKEDLGTKSKRDIKRTAETFIPDVEELGVIETEGIKGIKTIEKLSRKYAVVIGRNGLRKKNIAWVESDEYIEGECIADKQILLCEGKTFG